MLPTISVSESVWANPTTRNWFPYNLDITASMPLHWAFRRRRQKVCSRFNRFVFSGSNSTSVFQFWVFSWFQLIMVVVHCKIQKHIIIHSDQKGNNLKLKKKRYCQVEMKWNQMDRWGVDNNIGWFNFKYNFGSYRVLFWLGSSLCNHMKRTQIVRIRG